MPRIGRNASTAEAARQRNASGASTGAAGGFLAACAATERDDTEFFPTALDAGLQRAARAISQFGLGGLLGR